MFLHLPSILLHAPSLSLQPKSHVSDFGQLIKWPNSGKPEFGCKRGRECTEYAALNCFKYKRTCFSFCFRRERPACSRVIVLNKED